MRFFKKNSYEIVRLFVIQIGIMIFSFIVSAAAFEAFSQNKAGAHLVVCVFAVLFYLFVLYTTVWNVGLARSERVQSGREKADKFYGAKIALFANLPNIFLCFLMGIGLFHLVFPNSFFSALFGLARLLEGLLNANYLGIITYLADSDRYVLITLLSAASVLPSVLVSQIACTLGEKNIRVTKAAPPSLE